MNNKFFLGLMAGALFCHSAQADEGQWQPHQLTQLQAQFTQAGIALPAAQFADLNSHPMNAVVGLGYCSAAFVSNEGLVVTNHHCAAGAIQYNSSAENNRTKDGFLATTKAMEPSAGPQERLYITESTTDVTDKVIGKLDSTLTGKARFDAIENNRKTLIAECESNPDYRCSVRSFHHGMQYFLLKQLMIQDVRLVYAPPEAIGNYGGDIDNYEYPRHTGDFTFLRAYVDKSGKPAPFSEDNVPYRPKSWLKVNADGVQKGDGIVLAGYPGRTSRYRLASEVALAGDWFYPKSIEMREQMLEVIDENTKDRPEAKVAYSSSVGSINNGMKKYKGMLAGFKATDISAIKQQKEAELLDWIKQDAKRSHYADSHQKLTELLAQSHEMDARDFYYSYVLRAQLLRQALSLYRLAKEFEKPDSERKPGYQERDLPMFKARQKRMQKRYDQQVDNALWALYVDKYLNQPHRVDAFDKAVGLRPMSRRELTDHLAGFYNNSQLHDEQVRLSWIGKPVSAFEQSKDSFIQLAVKLYDTNMAFEAEEEELSGLLAQVRPQYMQAIIAFNESKGLPVYPDANGTLRVTYGTVDGYPAADGIYKTAFTTIKGALDKHTGVKPFNLPAKVKSAIEREKDQSIPVNFLSSADTTGGNSGSPVMNGKGELVGLNFDSTFESITKDWYFNPRITRAIHVDIRYLLWMLEKVENGDNLLKELSIVRG